MVQDEPLVNFKQTGLLRTKIVTGGALLAALEDDVIQGGDKNDEVDAGAGNDVVNGGAGNDVLRGGDGGDTKSGRPARNAWTSAPGPTCCGAAARPGDKPLFDAGDLISGGCFVAVL